MLAQWWPNRSEKVQASLVLVACSWVACGCLCYIAWMGDTPGSGVKYAWQLRRYSWAPYAPWIVLATNSFLAPLAWYGCRRGDRSLLPWSALGLCKCFDMLVQAAWAAVGKHYIFIFVLVVAHWGGFCALAYVFFLQTDLATLPESTGLGSAATYSYAAGSAEERQQLSFWTRAMAFLPVARGFLEDASRRQKMQGRASV